MTAVLTEEETLQEKASLTKHDLHLILVALIQLYPAHIATRLFSKI